MTNITLCSYTCLFYFQFLGQVRDVLGHRPPVSSEESAWRTFAETVEQECFGKVSLELKQHLTFEVISCIKRYRHLTDQGSTSAPPDNMYHSRRLWDEPINTTTATEERTPIVHFEVPAPFQEVPTAQQHIVPPASPSPSPSLNLTPDQLTELKKLLISTPGFGPRLVTSSGRSSPAMFSEHNLNFSSCSLPSMSSVVTEPLLQNPRGSPGRQHSSASLTSTTTVTGIQHQ